MADFKFVKRAKRPVTLKEIKESGEFADLALVRQGRLSTMEVPAAFWKWVGKRAF